MARSREVSDGSPPSTRFELLRHNRPFVRTAPNCFQSNNIRVRSAHPSRLGAQSGFFSRPPLRCESRTARVDSVDAVDLKALRAWKSGDPLAPSVIYGRILSSDLRAGIRVRLTKDQNGKLTHLDANGGFSFEGLEKAQYRLEVQDARGTGGRVIDLSRLGCFEATPWFSDVWHIAGSPVLLEMKSPPIPEIPDPPTLNPRRTQQ